MVQTTRYHDWDEFVAGFLTGSLVFILRLKADYKPYIDWKTVVFFPIQKMKSAISMILECEVYKPHTRSLPILPLCFYT